MSPRWSARLRRLVPSLVLALWLAPQLLLAAHGHWMQHDAASDCDICVQLASSLPAVDSAPQLPPPVWVTSALEPRKGCVTRRYSDVACRGPPAFSASPVI